MRKRIGVPAMALAGCLLAGALVSTAVAAETGYKVTADYFSWTVNRGEMDYAYPDNGDVSTVDPGADGGFRLGFEIMKGPATDMIGYAAYEVEEEDDRVPPGERECSVTRGPRPSGKPRGSRRPTAGAPPPPRRD